MKLRTKLIFFVLGVVIIPLLVSGLIGYYLHLRREWVPSPQQMDRILDRFEMISTNSKAMPDFSSIEIPHGLSVFVVDAKNRIIYTNNERYEKRKKPESFHFERGLFLVHPMTLSNGDEIKVMFHFPPGPEDVKKPPPLYVRFLERSKWWLFAIILFSAVMITIIVRSFNRSIRSLEQATRRVAEGDLDFKLSTEGKDEIASLTRSFDSMRKDLKEAGSRRSRFLMGVSHDLKTPLTSIKGYVEAISDGLADDRGTLNRYLSVIGEKSKVLEERIAELIDYVNMETGEWKMKQEEIELLGFFDEISLLYRQDAVVFKRTFRADIQIPEHVCVIADRALLLRCFENLFDNAMRYTEEGGSIILSAVLTGDRVIVVFQNSGTGINKNELGRLFEPFYRGTRSRREHGSGLGLSIVKSIIDAHGWSIGVDSTPGEHTTFTIHITPVQ
jgi:signal transduction histidine kinase